VQPVPRHQHHTSRNNNQRQEPVQSPLQRSNSLNITQVRTQQSDLDTNRIENRLSQPREDESAGNSTDREIPPRNLQKSSENLELREEEWLSYDIGDMDSDFNQHIQQHPVTVSHQQHLLSQSTASQHEGQFEISLRDASLLVEEQTSDTERQVEHLSTQQHANSNSSSISSSSSSHALVTSTPPPIRQQQEDDDDNSETRPVDNRIIVRAYDNVSLTVHEARSELLRRHNTVNDATQMDLFLLDDNISPSPEEEDPANIWTEQLVQVHRTFINRNYDGRTKSNLAIVTNKISRYRKSESSTNFFCVVCWQKYKQDKHHDVKVCKDGVRLREIALHHHIHGENAGLLSN